MNRYWLNNKEFIKEWCIYNKFYQINNCGEGWNARINSSVNKNYVTIARLLSVLVKDISNNKMAMSKAVIHKINDGNYREKGFMLNVQMKMVHKEISVGNCLEKLR